MKGLIYVARTILTILFILFFVLLLKNESSFNPIIGFIIGLVISAFVIIIEIIFTRLTAKQIMFGIFGLGGGLLIANLLGYAILNISQLQGSELIRSGLLISFNLAFAYLGIVIGIRKRDELRLSPFFQANRGRMSMSKVLDTSVIIDGRIADICETGFLEGTLIIPKFVLQELQYIADSADALKRNRGRRGLDILKKIQEQNDVGVVIDDTDFPELKEVDSKLVKLAETINGKILTNDFNLNKVAELHGVPVLNINELANALKPVVLPNEEMRIRLMKRGKEYDQGVGYLEDGTMVVVDDARNHIGKTVDVVVTSVLQTTAGRMIFSKIKTSDQNQPSGPSNWNQPSY